jgi:DHA2 family multidrug resistance protein-like MFS transporter
MTTSCDAPASQPTGRAGRREWIGLAVLALPTLLLSLDLSVLYLALPQLSADLRPSATQLLWITDVYGFLIAGFLITMGRLGDRIGHRRLLVIGAVAFAAASVFAAYSTSAELLISARALLGIAGATQMPATLALIRTMFADPGQRAMAIAAWVSIWTAGTAIGPAVGGLLLESFWWGSVFLLGVPVMAVLLATAWLLPESRNPDSARLDLGSVALSLAAILPFVYGLKEFAQAGIHPVPAVAMAAGTVTGVLFVRRQRVRPNPLLDLGLFANRDFSTVLLVMAVGLVTIGGTYLFVTQFLQAVAGLPPLHTAMWLLAAAVANILGAMFGAALARRIRPQHVVAAGLLVAAVGFLLLLGAAPDAGLAAPVTGLILIQAGVGPLVALGTDLVVGSVPPRAAGSASSISETSTELGVAMGVAVLGALGTAVYRNQIEHAIPTDAPAAVAHAAYDSISSALAAAQTLPGPLAGDLIDAAREAFTTGLHVVAAVSTLLCVAVAVLASTAFRPRTPGRRGTS